MPQRPNLLEYAKVCVKNITNGFTNPQADFMPVLLVHGCDDKVAIVGLPGDMDDADAKDQMAQFMFATTACLRATEVALVTTAWSVKTINKEEYESGEFTMPRDHPDRIEVVNIMYAGSDGDVMSSAEITRYEDEGKPPTIGDWDDMGGKDVTVGGRFGDAIHDGIDVGQKLADAPGPIVEFMDEMMAKGEVEELVQHFLNGMGQAAQMAAAEQRRKDASDSENRDT